MEVLDQVCNPTAVRGSGTPKRFWLWSKYGPSGPLPAPGHSNPRPSHSPLLFSWLQNASGYLSTWGVSFFSLIFTHKMCISRTKAAMMSSLVSANFFPVSLRNSCATSISNPVFGLSTQTDTAMYHAAFFFTKWISKALYCIKLHPPSITENDCPPSSANVVFSFSLAPVSEDKDRRYPQQIKTICLALIFFFKGIKL